jgi:hypothetical protein
MTAPSFPPPRIAALRADAIEEPQALLEAFAQDLRKRGVAVAGVTQTRVLDAATGRRRIVLRDIVSGALWPISQDLGPGSVACNLDADGLARACASIESATRAGVDLVVISKFSKQEAERGGLADAFRAAISSGAPIVTAVSPHFLEEWSVFAGHLAHYVEPDLAALIDWWTLVAPTVSKGA